MNLRTSKSNHHKTMKAKTKDICIGATCLAMLAALIIGSGDPTPESNLTAYWLGEAVCFAVIVAGAFILRAIYKTSTNNQ